MAKKNNANVTSDTAIVKKEAPGALAAWEQEALAEAKGDAARFQAGTQRISFQGGNISVDGNKVKDNRLVVAVIEAAFGKAYYLGDFDPSTPQTPVCYAFHATDQNAMVPHTACPDKQSPQCSGCQHNKFGTAERGNGKRCKDEIRLMVVAPGEDYEGAEVRMATVPPGSLQNWAKYVQRLADMNATFRTVLTEIGIEPYKGAYKLTFNPQGKLTKEAFFALKARRDRSVEQAMQPYPVLEVEEKPKAKAKKLKGQ